MGHMYTPKTTREYEKMVGEIYRATREPMCMGNVEMHFVFVRQMPKAWSRKKREEMNGMPCETKPDVDNLVKAVMDGLNGIAYEDDSQVVRITARKEWGEEGHTEVEII